MTIYPLVNQLVDPETSLVLMETNLPTPTTARVYVNLPEGKLDQPIGFETNNCRIR